MFFGQYSLIVETLYALFAFAPLIVTFALIGDAIGKRQFCSHDRCLLLFGGIVGELVLGMLIQFNLLPITSDHALFLIGTNLLALFFLLGWRYIERQWLAWWLRQRS